MEVKILDGIIEDFFKVAHRVYESDKIWVQESKENIMNTIKKYNSKVFIGYVNNIPNSRVVVFFKKREAWLGFFEAVTTDFGIKLLKVVETFCQKKNIELIIGPKIDNLIQGLLIKGFDLPQTILTNYNPKYYKQIFSKSKYDPSIKMMTLEFSKKFVKKPKLKNCNVNIRMFNLNELEKEIVIFHKLQNEIFASHDRWVKRSLNEDKELIYSFLPIIDPELILIAQINKKPVGLLICLPDINQKLKGKVIDNARIVSIGVKKDYSRRGIGLLMANKLMETLFDKGYKTAEASWILKTNLPPQLLCKKFNAKLSKVYVVYSKKLY